MSSPEPSGPPSAVVAGGDPAGPASARPPSVVPVAGDPHPGLLRGLLHLVYDGVWMGAALAALPWVAWRYRRSGGTAGMILEQLGRGLGAVPRTGRRRVLLHGVSVGEVKGAQPLVRAIEAAHPELEIVLSTTTNTGLSVCRELFPDHRVVRFPADISFTVRRFLERLRPDFVVLVELEIWPNFLRLCNRRRIPVTVVNGRITDRSHSRYVLFKRLLPQFDRISLYCVQSEEYAERFRGLDVAPERILVTGNVKTDGLRVGPVDPGDELRSLLGAPPGKLVLVAGSTHDPEERLVFEAWRRAAPETRLILVPRHPQRAADVVRDLERRGLRPQLLSELRKGRVRPDPGRPALVDTIGELERVYGLADLVFVGGSLIPHGGQNVLEPAAQGRAVLFGPHVSNFTQEVGLLVESGAARPVADAEDLARALEELVGDPARRERMGAKGLAAVERQKGATRKTVEALRALGMAGS